MHRSTSISLFQHFKCSDENKDVIQPQKLNVSSNLIETHGQEDIQKTKRSVGNMDIVRNLIILVSLLFVRASSSSIGSEFESSLSCSKFHFEEKVLEKLVRLELKMDTWDKSITSKLDEMNNIKKQTETFVQSVQDAQIQDQTRFNKSYQEIVENLKTQVDNETENYGDQMNALLESLYSTIGVFTEAEKKRESVLGINAVNYSSRFEKIQCLICWDGRNI
ncbi:unnamed protein product [Mytilus edulis]|uniref:Uncharacterized protein n=1 Tax=Mytilus edulis TaxID=6550 RepID=A0A8S3SZ00_MYTED|nr:unnamed protein product [Mytilus edulis]